MNIIDLSIKKPVSIVVGVVLILMFGFVALSTLPYKLTPNVTQPEIGVSTIWPGATPSEVERDIIDKQEEQLKSTPDLVAYKSTASDNIAEITLTFEVGTDMNKALLEVSNKLNQVEAYPENVLKPIIASAGANASPIIWMGFVANADNSKDIDTYKTFLNNEVKEQIERVKGVASIFIPGGTQEQMHIKLFPERLAAYNLSIDQIAAAIQAENQDTAAGTVDIDRRTYRVRTTARFKSVKELEAMVLFHDGQRSIRLGDVAIIEKGYEKVKANILVATDKGINKALIYGIRVEPSANVVDTTNRVEAVVKHLNDNILPAQGIHLQWFYDQRDYIEGAINLVKQNIAVGGFLAIIILLLFLRSFSSTAVVAMAIPVSIISTFIVLGAMDRSLNTISLAGISFAVGMLLDSAIVVLENIDRHRKMGKGFFQAAHDGTMEVWGALIASALTTIAVFLPVIFLESEAGQLFKDIAIAVTAAITFSLFVSISVIPMLWTQLMRFTSKEDGHSQKPIETEEHKSVLVSIGSMVINFFMAVVYWSLKRRINQVITVLTLGSAAVVTIGLLFPKMEYLPQGNQNLVLNILIPPPGLSEKESKSIGYDLYEHMKPHYKKEEIDNVPPIKRTFYVSSGDFIIQGMISQEEQRAAEYIPFMSPAVNSFPGIFGLTLQRGVFEQGIGEGRNIDIDISGENIETLANIGGMLFGTLMQKMPGAQIRPVPSIEVLFPEAQLIPDRNALASVGLNSSSFGFAADVLMDGRKISEYVEEGKKSIDMILKSYDDIIDSPEALYMTQVATPTAGLIPMSELAHLLHTTGITKIRHVAGKRTITLQVTPPMTMTLEEAVEILDQGILSGMRSQGMFKGANVSLAGKADKLAETVESMQWNLLFALIIIYLLMSALFGNFIYPLVIMFTVPMATAGGFIGLGLTNMFIAPQPLDILTMLGFIILIGIVVNNAILIVHQSLNNIRFNGMEHREAIIEATRSRLRPIFMSSMTSIFGMLPLVLVPGPGSEFYRGLGSVITGGLGFSMFFTIFVTPALMYFAIGMEKIGTKKETSV
ncbi:MAG: efflux RND transporter permease subunit [Campylobacterota bacterium]|nr:efflux RND transporter permease subunit [Campylobacterota bacterium]